MASLASDVLLPLSGVTALSIRVLGHYGARKQTLVAMSEAEFTGLHGLGVQFIDGGLYVKHVAGNYRHG